MILSFSRPEMVPWLKAGLLAADWSGDKPLPGERTKRQTIRRRGPRGRMLLEFAATHDGTIPYALHLWWKSRTPERAPIGVVEPRHWPRVYPIHIKREAGGGIYVLGVRGFVADPFFDFCWTPADVGISMAFKFAHADGFDSVEAFRDFFVPNEGDRFDAILFKW